MTSIDSTTDTTILRLALAALVAFLLAGTGILVSANTHIPLYTNSQRLLPLEAEHRLSTTSNLRPIASLSDGPTPISRHPRIVSSRHHPEAVSATVALTIEPASRIDPVLSAEQLIQNALSALRGLPDYFPTDMEYDNAVANLNQTIESQQLEINVKTFLLSQGVSNESRLAELQMQPFFAEFDRSAFSKKQGDEQIQSAYIGVGFPHIESNNRSAANRYKPYKQLVSVSDDASGYVVPYVKCMGLSPERVAKRAKRYDAQIEELAVKYDVNPSLIKAVVAKESCFNPKARSPVGAIGLMQLMPATAQWLKVKQPENPQQNLAAGVRYLAQLQERFGGDELALAAYNAGPGNVERYHGIPPFDETENYVVDVMHFYRGYVATISYVNAQNQYYYP